MVIGTSTVGAPISNVVESMAQHLRNALADKLSGPYRLPFGLSSYLDARSHAVRLACCAVVRAIFSEPKPPASDDVRPVKEKRTHDDVERDRRGDAASRPAVLHHAGDRGQEERRARARGRR